MATGNSQEVKKPAPQRLLSLRGERDLTLGALTLNNKKKNFCPVLPSQAKPKVKQEIVSEFAPPPEVQLKRKPGVLQHNDRTKPTVKDVRSGHGRGRDESNADESQFVQMKSVFSEGPMMAQAHVNNSRLHSGGGGRSSDRTMKEDKQAGSSLAMKSTDKGEEAMEWDADTKDVLQQLLRDDFINDQSLSTTDAQDMAPVRLPLSSSRRMDTKAKPKVKCKMPRPMRRIKDDDESEMPQATCRADSSVSHHDASLLPAEIFAADSELQNELLLFQLPDVLPGVPFSKDSGHKTTNSGSCDSLKCSLSDFEENTVGRLVVRCSGRTQLVLGSVAFDISAGSTSSCLQDLASLRVEEGSVGSLTMLGHVRHKLLCIPDLTTLLDSGHSNS